MLTHKKHALYPGQYLILILIPGTDAEITRIVGRAVKTFPLGDSRTAYDLYLHAGYGEPPVQVEHFAGSLTDLKTWLKDKHYATNVEGRPYFAFDGAR